MIETTRRANPDIARDPAVLRRRDELIAGTDRLVDAIRALGTDGDDDPLVNPDVLARAVARGLLYAPQLLNNPYAPGRVRTRSLDGALWAVDRAGNPLDEARRLAALREPPASEPGA